MRIDCYIAFHDVTMTAVVTGIDLTYRFVKTEKGKLYFSDIYQIEILEIPG